MATWWPYRIFQFSCLNVNGTLLVYKQRSLLIFKDVAFKMAAWQPYWIFWFTDHKPKFQMGQFRDIQEIESGQVKHQELGQSNPSTIWGGSPTGKWNLIDRIFFITTAFWMQVLYWNQVTALLFACVVLVRCGRSANMMEFSLLVRNPSTVSGVGFNVQPMGSHFLDVFYVLTLVWLWISSINFSS